ncbi:hypothetical protein GCM10009865_07730 [Aeromicrobium ponti]
MQHMPEECMELSGKRLISGTGVKEKFFDSKVNRINETIRFSNYIFSQSAAIII